MLHENTIFENYTEQSTNQSQKRNEIFGPGSDPATFQNFQKFDQKFSLLILNSPVAANVQK